ncbi:MAG: MFS transporter [Proteobacteria bacterium]|nr:MFS transporter [Pseudomonadota bacterium]
MSNYSLRITLLGWSICLMGAVFYCYEYFLRILPSTITPELMQHYQIGAGALGNLAAFYYYIYTPMQIPVGVLMDRYGPRRLLTMACGLCALGSYLFITPSYWMAAFGRFLIGFGSAFGFVGVLKLATVWLPPSRFSLVTGITMTLAMIGALAGNIVIAHLVELKGWQSTLFLAAHLGVLLTLIIFVVVKDKHIVPRKSVPIDWPHLMKSVLRVLLARNIWLCGIIGACMYLSLSVFAELWGIPFLTQAKGFSRTEASIAVSMIFLGWAIGSPVIGYVSERLKTHISPIIIGSLLAALFMGVVILFLQLSFMSVCILLFLVGFTISAEILVFTLGWEAVNNAIAGTAIAVVNMLVMLAGVFLQPLVGILLDMAGNEKIIDGIRIYAPTDYQNALLIIPLSFLLAAVLAGFLRKHKKIALE